MLLTLGMNAQSEKSIKKTSIWYRNQSYQPTGYGTIHVEVFWIIANCCKSAHNKKCPKLNGTKKCNSKKWEI